MVDYNALHEKIAALIQDAGIEHSCISCAYFNEAAEVCQKYSNQRPPARVIVLGCNSYEPQVPF